MSYKFWWSKIWERIGNHASSRALWPITANNVLPLTWKKGMNKWCLSVIGPLMRGWRLQKQGTNSLASIVKTHKDKNTIFYHRVFKLCKVYKSTKTLKMYPAWDKSEQGKKQRIGIKYGKWDSPPLSNVPSPTKRPPPLHLDREVTSTQCTDVFFRSKVFFRAQVTCSSDLAPSIPTSDQCPTPPGNYSANVAHLCSTQSQWQKGRITKVATWKGLCKEVYEGQRTGYQVSENNLISNYVKLNGQN